MKPHHTDRAPAAVGPYSQAMEAGGWCWMSGQVALDPASGTLVGETAADQANQVFENLGAVLAGAGLRKDQVVRCTVYLLDMADFQAVNEVYAAFFGDHRPARACVAVVGLPKGARVEIDAIAFRG